MTHGGRRTVHFVLSVQGEEHVKGAREDGVGAVSGVAHRVQHVQKILCIFQPLARWRRPTTEPPASVRMYAAPPTRRVKQR